MANWAWAAAAAALAIGSLHPGRASADSGQGASPLADDRTMVALAVALACAEAPEAVPAEPGDGVAPTDEGPELELVATVHAKALKFDVVPRTQVVFSGNTKRKTVWKTERVNLPMQPQPGVVYRDVRVRLTVTSGLEELTSLLHEAKRASTGIVLEQDAPASATVAGPAVAAARPADPVPPPPPPPPALVEAPKPAAPGTASTPAPAPTATATATAAPAATPAPAPAARPGSSPPAPAAAPAAPARLP